MVRLEPALPRPATYAEEDLFRAVMRRRSNRAPFWPESVAADLRARLVDAARAQGAWLELLIGMTALSGFAVLVT